jgi:apolipoprotein N-acyltransferase
MAVLSGLLLTGAFPKMEFSWLSWFAIVPLLASIKDQSPRKSFRLGFLAGIIHYLTLMYWLGYTMHTYGRLPWSLSIPVLFLLTCYLSLYFGAFSFFVSFLCRIPSSILFLVPVLWVSFEYLRAVLFSGLPWELMGYTQYKILPILQLSDVFGVYGISFLIAFSNAVIFMGSLFATGKNWKEFPVSKRLAGVSILTGIFTMSLVWIYGMWRITVYDRLIEGSPKAHVAVVQGNIDQVIKWDPEHQEASVEKYLNLSRTENPGSIDLIVWPETAMPFYFLYDTELTLKVFQGIQTIGADFLIGSPSYIRRGNRIDYYNSAYLVRPDGKIYSKYSKVHLVPFGEYVPFRKWLPFLGKMVAQVGDFKPGKSGQTMPWGAHRIGMQICFEIIFPHLSRTLVKNEANLLVNITNDAWFGKSSAPYQHFSMAVFRAVENKRSLVRSANTGISGFVDPTGKILASTPLFTESTLTRDVSLLQTRTIYSRIGDLFAWTCLALAFVVVIRRAAFRRKG